MVATSAPMAPDMTLQAVRVQRAPAPLWEQGLVSMWFLVTFIPFPRDEFLLYPLALFFAGSFALRFRQMVPLMIRCWPLFLVPFFSALSMFWAPGASQALRFGIMMTLTVIIGVYIAGRMTPRQIVRAVFVACALSVFIAIPEVNSLDDEIGLYPQKNIFAIRMMMALFLALGVALDRGQNILLRLIAAPFIPLTLYLVYRADSVTALILSGAGLLVMLMVWLLWTNVSRVRHMRTIAIGFLMAIGIAGTLVLINQPNNTLVQDALFSVGKDTTLTNRTVIWRDATIYAQDNPWFGVGAEGFWQWWNGRAESILDYSHKRPGTKFSFHSTYFEVLVHLGYIGLTFMIWQIVWCTLNAVIAWFRKPEIPQSLFLLIAMITVITSFTESYLFGVFDISIILFLVAGVSAFSESSRTRSVVMAVPNEPDAGLQPGFYSA